MVSRGGKGIVKLHCHFPNLVGIPKKKKLHKLHYFSQLELEIFLENSLPFCVIVLNFVGIGLKVVSNPCFLRKKGRKPPHNSRFESVSKFQPQSLSSNISCLFFVAIHSGHFLTKIQQNQCVLSHFILVISCQKLARKFQISLRFLYQSSRVFLVSLLQLFGPNLCSFKFSPLNRMFSLSFV